MDLRHLALFCRVVELGSFSLAAEEMGVTQPAASQQVRSLEKRFETRLLDRSGRDVTPTDAGRVLYRYASHMLDDCDRATREIGDLSELLAGRVDVGASTGPGEHILPGLIADFSARHPKVTVSLRVTATREVIEQVLARDLEIGVVGAVAHERDLIVGELCRDEIVITCRPDHGWAGRDDVSLEELCREPLVVQQRGAGIRDVFDAQLRERGLREQDLHVAFEMGLNESVKNAVMAGAGVTYLSKYAVANEVAAGT
ncbi:MAG: LysR family transcriptional regulator, partial [Actinobacteria bacterium]|nr:LysR family transcriptional regulator [Actinomycetota bacterium]